MDGLEQSIMDAPIMDMETAKQQYPGLEGPVDAEMIAKLETVLKSYKDGKATLESRIVENELWFQRRHWEVLRSASASVSDPEPASAWLFNSIANKHADYMDNFPQPNVLPRAQDDKQDAKTISDVLPVVLEQNGFEQTYNDCNWYKLKHGPGAYGVFYDFSKLGGLGDIDIRKLDILNLFWEPGINNLQKSRYIFNVDLVDKDIAKEQYPWINVDGTSTLEIKNYIYDDSKKADHSNKALSVDCYYHKRARGSKKTLLHYIKFINGQLAYASENDTTRPQTEQIDPNTGMPVIGPDGAPVMVETGLSTAERGWYDHGEYPFEFDVQFPEAGSPTGFGYIDICKEPQLYIDKLDQSILKHAKMLADPRWWKRAGNNIKMDEFNNPDCKVVEFTGNDPRENIMRMDVGDMPSAPVQIREQKVEELKETSGNRDFSQGGTAAGVTAASAIAALQEAGSKLSRDMIKSSYRSFQRICYLCIELMRQFYDSPREFRITGRMGEENFVTYSNANIKPVEQGNEFGIDLGTRKPIFDIKVTAQKASPFSTVAQNERAKEFYTVGFFNPSNADQALAALEMMDFDQIEMVRQRISQNGTMLSIIQQLAPLALQMAAESGNQMYMQAVMQILGRFAPQQPQVGTAMMGQEQGVNALGAMVNESRSSTAGQARKQAAQAATPR